MTAPLATLWILSTLWFGRIWYSVPLIIVISLVYAAKRHEMMKPILEHALRFGLWVIGFMAIVFGVLALISVWL